MTTIEMLALLKDLRDMGATTATVNGADSYGALISATVTFPEPARYQPIPAGFREVEPVTPPKPLTEEEQRIADDEELVP